MEYWECQVCKKYFIKEDFSKYSDFLPITSATGHKYIAEECENCGRATPVYQKVTSLESMALQPEDTTYIIVAELNGKIISSCVCVIIPNLTRNQRPYAFVENVVTHSDFRGKGIATACLNYAREIAKSENCYKLMLLTGSKNENTLNFYRRAGYNSEDKKAFIQWLE